MRETLSALKPYLFGSFLMLAFTLLSAVISYFIQNNGMTYFICGVSGAVGIGFLLYQFARPISPLTVLIIIPCMFSGVLISEYYHISREKIVGNARPSDIRLHKSSLLFELTGQRILTEMKSSHTYVWRHKDKSRQIRVHTVPVVDTNWTSNEAVGVFAVCENNYCDKALMPHNRFAKVLSPRTSDHYKTFTASAMRNAKEHGLIITDTPIIVELIADVKLYAIKKKRHAAVIFLGLLFLWNAASFLIVRYELKTTRKK